MKFIHICSFIKKRLEKILGDFNLVRGGIRTDIFHVSDLHVSELSSVSYSFGTQILRVGQLNKTGGVSKRHAMGSCECRCFQIHTNRCTVWAQPNSDHLLRVVSGSVPWAFTLPVYHAHHTPFWTKLPVWILCCVSLCNMDHARMYIYTLFILPTSKFILNHILLSHIYS